MNEQVLFNMKMLRDQREALHMAAIKLRRPMSALVRDMVDDFLATRPEEVPHQPKEHLAA